MKAFVKLFLILLLTLAIMQLLDIRVIVSPEAALGAFLAAWALSHIVFRRLRRSAPSRAAYEPSSNESRF